MGNPRRDADVFRRHIERSHPLFVNAVARAFAILRGFDSGNELLGNQEIARRTGLPKATVSRLTFTLSALGYLHYYPEQEKYALGTGALSLGHAFLKDNKVIDVARPLMAGLAEHTRAAVMLAIADATQERMVLLAVCQGDPMFRMNLAAGARVPHGSTALGRADLAVRPLAEFEQQLARLERECEPGYWPRLQAGIVKARQDYEAMGFCFSLGDWNAEVFAIGVPLVSADGSRVLALNCSGRVSTMTREVLTRDVGPRLLAVRDEILRLTQGRF